MQSEVKDQTGLVTTFAEKRMIVEAAKRSALRFGLTYKSYSGEWVIVLENADSRRIICGYAIGVNADAADTVAKDKVGTYELLAAANLNAVPHHLLSTLANIQIDREQLVRLLARYSELVVKPLKGKRGELVARFARADDILAYTATSPNLEWAAAPYIDIQQELRLAVFDSEIYLAYEKVQPVVIGNLKLFNLGRGTKAKYIEPSSLPDDYRKLAMRSMDALGLRLGGVDIVVDSSGTARVLEINSHFSLDHFAEMSASNEAIVLQFYELIISRMFGLD